LTFRGFAARHARANSSLTTMGRFNALATASTRLTRLRAFGRWDSAGSAWRLSAQFFFGIDEPVGHHVWDESVAIIVPQLCKQCIFEQLSREWGSHFFFPQ
jgi:hypothetical protein